MTILSVRFSALHVALEFLSIFAIDFFVMYRAFYNLDKKPFQLNADPEFFFESSVHKRAKAYLRYGLEQGEGFVLVTGVPGTGKTMLVKELFQTLVEDEDLVVGLMVTSQLGADDTLRVLAATFGIHYQSDDNKAALLQALQNYLYGQAQIGKRVLLVVDEAQNLPKESLEELRMLSNFDLDGKPIFQIFLIGQEQLGELLNNHDMEQVRQRIVAAYHLKAIDESETKQYIHFRLEKAGWKSTPNFENTVFKRIYEYSQGIPRKINTLCDRVLLYGYLEELTTITLESVKRIISEIEEETVHLTPTEVDISFQANVDQSHVARIETLEKKVSELSAVINKERALLRKAVLLQLDMDDVYDDTM